MMHRALTALALMLIFVLPVWSETGTAEINGFTMHYEIAGQGEPLVMLHAWSGNGRDYEPFIEEFSKQYRLILPDLRGHGGSTNPSGAFTFAQSARDVFALLDHLKINRFRAVGASMGGITLLHMATSEQAGRIEAMILVGAGHRFPPACRTSMSETTMESFPEPWWTGMESKHRHGRDQIKQIAGFLNTIAEDKTDVAFTGARLQEIKTRTLLVYGDHDWCFPPTLGAELYSNLPNALLWIVPGGGHVPITGKHAAGFTATALEFLAAD